MADTQQLSARLQRAWQGRISGCMLGKAVELFSMREGADALEQYLSSVNALPLRDYIPYDANHASELIDKRCCAGQMQQSSADDDINYSTLALIMLEKFGDQLNTADVARTWMKYLPVASTFTAERAAYRTLLNKAHEWFPEGRDPGFDLLECADNDFNDWIGAQIRADVYGWVCPGNPQLAARLVTEDAQLSHRTEGIYGAVLVAVWGALIPVCETLEQALDQSLDYIPADSDCAAAVQLARGLVGNSAGGALIRDRYPDMSVVHTVNNLALVVWALLSHPDDFSAAVGDVVAAGLDTDCNGATVGALWGLQDKQIPAFWAEAWGGQVGLSLAGTDTVHVDELIDRSVKVTLELSEV
jgi:ADP-ribosylglycohydrolase